MKYLSDYKEEEIENAFRERTPKDTALLLKLSSKAKTLIEQAAFEEDLDASVFIRRAVEKEIIRLSKQD
jgi:hypothetical protein